MRRVKQFGLLAVVAGALLVPASVASANTTVACVFNGVTGNLNPAIPGIVADASLDEETGTFTFNGGVNCAGNDNGTPRAEAGTVNASGTYVNQLCGTGTADGTSTVTLPSGTVTASFHIDFRGGNGVITITNAQRNNGETGTGSGAAQLVPDQGNCVTTPVNTFRVAGGFQAQLS